VISPGLQLAGRALRTWLSLILVLVPTVLLVSSAERAAAPGISLFELLRLVGPVCAAAALAWTVAASRIEGSWDGWTALGLPVLPRVAPAFVLAVLGAVTLSGLVVQPPARGAGDAVLGLPGPVPAAATFWMDGDRWTRPDLSRWKEAPGRLPTWALVKRLLEAAPVGARSGVDGAELITRLSLGVAWLLAVPMGCWSALRRTSPASRRTGSAGLAASLESLVLVLVWQVFGLLAAAYACSMT
jgi:hypothetical protein